jgi:hypothetical protein
MSTTGKIALGIGIASGALITAYLLTGDRKTTTRQFVTRRAENLKKSMKPTKRSFDDSEVYYI